MSKTVDKTRPDEYKYLSMSKAIRVTVLSIHVDNIASLELMQHGLTSKAVGPLCHHSTFTGQLIAELRPTFPFYIQQCETIDGSNQIRTAIGGQLYQKQHVRSGYVQSIDLETLEDLRRGCVHHPFNIGRRQCTSKPLGSRPYLSFLFQMQITAPGCQLFPHRAAIHYLVGQPISFLA
jgi:hypothetical protein